MELFRKMFNYLYSINNEDDEPEKLLSLQECSDLMASLKTKKLEENEEVEEKIPDNECFQASGKVTFVDEHFGLIDMQLYFEHPNISSIKPGMTLSYLGYKKDDTTKISRVFFNDNDDDWTDETKKETKPLTSRIQVAQVTERRGRLVKLDSGLEIDLNKVESEFVPMMGDWLSIQSLVEIDENVINLSGRVLEVSKISPLRVKLVDGVIKSYDRQTQSGTINHDIVFFKDVCSPGFVPVVRDKVTAEVIESEYLRYTWRALKVMPVGYSVNKSVISPNDKEESELLKDKNEISLPNHAAVNMSNLHEKQICIFEIKNKGTSEQTIISVRFKASSSSQLCLESPKMDNEIIIRPRQSVIFKIKCEAKFMGLTREMIIVSFAGFTIGRWIKIRVIPDDDREIYQKSHYEKNTKNLAKNAWRSYQNSNREVIVGPRPIKPPAFISNKLPLYDIPERIARQVFDLMNKSSHLADISVTDIALCLGQNLSIENYRDMFHILLYLEEIALMVNFRRYDVTRACFIPSGEFLILEVEGLSERRPSVIIGDKILAYNPLNSDDKPFEGIVHKTGKNHLYLQFHPHFHANYKGEDYAIEFHFSRTNFRRYHHAVDLAYRNLGKKILFPASVKTQAPQITFDCDDYEDSFINNTDSSIDLSSSSGTDETMKDAKLTTNAETKKNRESKYARMARMGILKERKTIKSESSDDSLQDIKEERLKLNEFKKIADETPIRAQAHNENIKKTKEKILNKKVGNSNELKLEWFDKKLNYYQKAAVKNILSGTARPLPYFIFGPPGTGKSITLIETMLQIIRMIPDSRILVCAPSNSAADLLAVRLLDSGVLQPGDLVRLVAYRYVSEGQIPAKLIPYCATGDLAREGTREIRKYTYNGVSIGVQASALGRHKITVGTCMIMGILFAMGFTRGHFTHIVIDEAGQATEPEMMIPMSLFDTLSSQAILAGDPRQLGPCIFSFFSKDYGLGESYFDRMLNRFPYNRDIIGFPDTGGFDPRLVTRLVYNYRSLPEILTLPNELFYQNELKATVSETDSKEAAILRQIADILPQRKSKLPAALVFHGVRGENYQTADSPSWFNSVEAGQVFYYINDLYRLGITSQDIGVITPYIRQGQQIRSLLIQENLDLPKIGTVEEFQGQEFKIVIMSCVRSNEIGAQNDSKLGLGFISSPRRVNVAITRAQSLLIIIGNPHLLVLDKYWRNVLLYAVEIGGYTGCDLPKLH